MLTALCVLGGVLVFLLAVVAGGRLYAAGLELTVAALREENECLRAQLDARGSRVSRAVAGMRADLAGFEKVHQDLRDGVVPFPTRG